MIDEDSKLYGEIGLAQALLIADSRGYDLVEMSATPKLSVCKLLDYGKFQYKTVKKLGQARKSHKQSVTKEIKFRPKIDTHDFNFKLRNILNFLEEGYKVKVVMTYRGREASLSAQGNSIIEQLLEKTDLVADVESKTNLGARGVILILSAKQKKI